MPDFAYIRKELLKNGVSKKLLWTEYMEDCRQAGDEPLMYPSKDISMREVYGLKEVSVK